MKLFTEKSRAGWMIVTTIIVLFAASFFVHQLSSKKTIRSVNDTSEQESQSALASKKTDKQAIIENNANVVDNNIESDFLRFLKSHHLIDNGIDNRGDIDRNDPYWQMEMLDEFRVLFETQYGARWEIELMNFLSDMFPEIYPALVEKMKNKMTYETWLENNLSQDYATLKDQEDLMWQKRFELFGDEAKKIWRFEMAEKIINDHLVEVGQAGDYDQQKQAYLNALQKSKSFLANNNEKLASNQITDDPVTASQQIANSSTFLSLPGVQSNLQSMSFSEQTESLRSIRKELGMSDEGLDRMAKLDLKRHEEWQLGKKYERERSKNTIAESELAEIRLNLFGEVEANMIKNEEEAGYFRYQQPHKIGIN